MTSPWDLALSKLEEPDYLRDVSAWGDRKLGVEMWSLSRRITEMVHEFKRVAVPACHDSSKSWTAALLVAHHIDVHKAGEARAITTAPSGAQVRSVLWGEINKMYEKARDLGAPLQGRVNQTEWWIGGWQAGIGRKPNDYKPEQFAGFHARFPFVVLDEADGLPPEMWDGVEALMTNRTARMLAIANPLDAGSRFAQVLKNVEDGLADDWAVLRIPYDQTPRFTGEPVSELLHDNLLDPEWVELKRIEWGGQRAKDDPTYQPDHPFWYGRILAIHPPQSEHTIVNIWELQRCREPDVIEQSRGVRQLGVDVAASEAGDVTVARERVGKHLIRKWTFQSADDDAIIDFMVEKALEMSAEVVSFDSTGMGTFVTGRLRQRLPRVAIVPINFGASATEHHSDGTRKYANLRAQLWWKAREMSADRSWDLSLAEDFETLSAELVSARYRPDVLSSKRVVQVESKDQIRKRLGRSPDDGDASLIAFYSAPGAGVARMTSTRQYSIPTGARSVTRR